nr:Protein-methionine-sulfoxide reductase heme-binding subunit MsrQ [Cupriavidus sp.]
MHRENAPTGLWWGLFLWASLPGWALVVQALGGFGLGPNPQEAIIRGLGQVSLVMLLWVYAMPLWARWADGQVVTARRAMGLWTFAYAAVHFLAYLQFEHDLLLAAVWNDIGQRPFVSVGLMGLLLLAALAVTSNRLAMRQLGARWKRLHRAIHLIVVLSLAHFFLHKMGKNDYWEVAVYAGLFLGVALLKALPMPTKSSPGRSSAGAAPARIPQSGDC